MDGTSRYSTAVCRSVPKSLVTQALRMNAGDTGVNYERAVMEHEIYVETLKQLGLRVVELEADESLPDCVFVEDPAVVCGKKALITNLGHPSRRGETGDIKRTLEELGVTCEVMTEPALLDGGDVLFTGKELFVGLSCRTDEKGMDVLKSCFPDYPVHGITVLENTLHLKSMMSMAGDDIIAIGQSSSAEQALSEILKKAKYKYEILKVSNNDVAANCLWINGHLIHRSSKEFPTIKDDFKSLSCPKLELSNVELAKVDGALTCCSLLIN